MQIYASKAKCGNSGDCHISSIGSYGKFTLVYIARRDVSALISECVGSFERDYLAHNFQLPCPSWQREGNISRMNN